MAGEPQLTCRDEDLHDRVEEYRTGRGLEHRSDAVKELLRVGLRETQSPLLTRFRERAIVIGEMLATFALVFLAGSIVTSAFPVSQGLLMAVVLLLFSVAIPGAVELARFLRGQSELGEMAREVRG